MRAWNLSRTVLVSALFFLGILLGGCAGVGEVKEGSNFPKVPQVSLVDIDGKNSSISDHEGTSVVLVNFWGLRCQNCIEEMPFLERLHNKYGSRGLVILGVNTDGVPGDLLKKFMPQLPLKVSYPIIVDPEFALVDAFEMMAAPLTVVVAKDGTVRFRHEGYEPAIEATYVDLIEKLLAE